MALLSSFFLSFTEPSQSPHGENKAIWGTAILKPTYSSYTKEKNLTEKPNNTQMNILPQAGSGSGLREGRADLIRVISTEQNPRPVQDQCTNRVAAWEERLSLGPHQSSTDTQHSLSPGMGDKNIFSWKSWAQAQPTDQPERVAGSQGLLGTIMTNSCLLVPYSRRDAKPNTLEGTLLGNSRACGQRQPREGRACTGATSG